MVPHLGPDRANAHSSVSEWFAAFRSQPVEEVIDEVERFEGDDEVVTVCPKGKSSVQAARLIASYEGFDGDVVSFEPGLSGWDGPLERANADGEATADTAAADGDSDEGPSAPF